MREDGAGIFRGFPAFFFFPVAVSLFARYANIMASFDYLTSQVIWRFHSEQCDNWSIQWRVLRLVRVISASMSRACQVKAP